MPLSQWRCTLYRAVLQWIEGFYGRDDFYHDDIECCDYRAKGARYIETMHTGRDSLTHSPPPTHSLTPARPPITHSPVHCNRVKAGNGFRIIWCDQTECRATNTIICFQFPVLCQCQVGCVLMCCCDGFSFDQFPRESERERARLTAFPLPDHLQPSSAVCLSFVSKREHHHQQSSSSLYLMDMYRKYEIPSQEQHHIINSATIITVWVSVGREMCGSSWEIIFGALSRIFWPILSTPGPLYTILLLY